MSRWGNTPPFTTTPRTKPITPKEGATPKTPAVKPHPKDGEGVMIPSLNILMNPLCRGRFLYFI